MATINTVFQKPVISLIIGFFILLPNIGISEATAINLPVTVGYVGEPPFIQAHQPVPQGMVIDLWAYINRICQFKNTSLVYAGTNYDAALADLAHGKYDVLIGNISMSSSRSRLVQFTTPFLLNKTALVIPKRETSFGDFFRSLGYVLFSSFGFSFLIIFLLILSISFIYCLSQRNINTVNIAKRSERAKKYIWITTLATIAGEVPEDPQNSLGRILIIISTIIGMVFLSLLGATFTTSLINSRHLVHNNANLSHLQGSKIIVERGSIQEHYITAIHATPIEVDTVNEGFQLLEKHPRTYKAFALDHAIASSYLKKSDHHHLEISPTFLDAELLAFSVPNGSPYLHKINGAMLYAAEHDITYSYCNQYALDNQEECRLLTL